VRVAGRTDGGKAADMSVRSFQRVDKAERIGS
jgi:hypothetical protein